jgi:two-component system chemotaxis response regulator CheB
MPQSAISYVHVDHVLPADEIAAAIVRLVGRMINGQGEREMSRKKELEPQQLSEPTEIRDMKALFGAPSGLTCPDCGGALWQVQEDRVVRYQCHVGHQYAPENLEAAQRDVIDGALWSAVRVLEEHAELKSRMAQRASEGGMRIVSEGFAESAHEAHEQAQRIRDVLLDLGTGVDPRVEELREAPSETRRATVRKPRRETRARRPRARRA